MLQRLTRKVIFLDVENAEQQKGIGDRPTNETMSTMDKHSELPATCSGNRFIGAHETRAQIIKECQNEQDYHGAFMTLYADPHVRLTTEADIKRAELIDKREHMVQRFIGTSLSEEQVDNLKEVTLPEGVLFKDLVLALFALEQRMCFVIERQKVSWSKQKEMKPPQSHPACTCYVIDVEEWSENEGPHLLGRFYRMPMVSDDYPGFFEVDIYPHAVTLHHIKVAHQVEVMYDDLGQPSPNTDTESYTFDFDMEKPSTGLFVCLSEGLCAWNGNEQRYDLVFPISALRSLFDWCEVQLLEEVKAIHAPTTALSSIGRI
jgi:hypothetical protein